MAGRTGFKTISWKDKIRCIDYIRENKDRLVAIRPTWVQLGQELTEKLKLSEGAARPYVIREIVKASEVEWVTPRVRRKGRNITRDTLRKLQNLILQLYDKVGEPLPDWWVNIPNNEQSAINPNLFAQPDQPLGTGHQ